MTPRLFICEGPDNVGKTSLAKILAAALPGLYWHMTCTEKLAAAMFDYQRNAVENIKENLKRQSVVMDRLWPSEVCYGKVLRPDTYMATGPIAESVAPLKPIYVFCMDEKGAENAADRHELAKDPAHAYDRENYLQIYQNYEALILEAQDPTNSDETGDDPTNSDETGDDPIIEVVYFDNRLVNPVDIAEYQRNMASALIRKYC